MPENNMAEKHNGTESSENNTVTRHVVGVRFKRVGRIYYFDSNGMELSAGDCVLVETSRGTELGQVLIEPKDIPGSEIEEPLKPVLRLATEEDVTRSCEFAEKEAYARKECERLIAKLKLPMKLLAAQYNFDGSRLTFFFSAEERVDFRRLVRELSSLFKMRVELRQVGSRDEAKIVGGYGRCGRRFCCDSFLCEFTPVSIKMAKEQSLPLNPMRISGVCGRLLCCLCYEFEQYRELKKAMPRAGQMVDTKVGQAKVLGVNPVKGTIVVEVSSGGQTELELGEVTFNNEPVRKPNKNNPRKSRN
jgi:cell fate regulator YaaT (PSP1 superfamily)